MRAQLPQVTDVSSKAQVASLERPHSVLNESRADSAWTVPVVLIRFDIGGSRLWRLLWEQHGTRLITKSNTICFRRSGCLFLVGTLCRHTPVPAVTVRTGVLDHDMPVGQLEVGPGGHRSHPLPGRRPGGVGGPPAVRAGGDLLALVIGPVPLRAPLLATLTVAVAGPVPAGPSPPHRPLQRPTSCSSWAAAVSTPGRRLIGMSEVTGKANGRPSSMAVNRTCETSGSNPSNRQQVLSGAMISSPSRTWPQVV